VQTIETIEPTLGGLIVALTEESVRRVKEKQETNILVA